MSDESWDTAERELQLLAVLDRFARDVEAGAVPRLSTYLARYPQFAAELTDFASDYLLTAAPPDTDTDTMPSVAASHSEVATRAALSPGSKRALARLFPGAGGDSGEPAGDDMLKAVAERRADYVIRDNASTEDQRGAARQTTGETDEKC